MKKKLILEESESMFSRLCQAACSNTDFDTFIVDQGYYCRDMGFIMELRVMFMVANKFGVEVTDELNLSKYRLFLREIHIAARGFEIEIKAN